MIHYQDYTFIWSGSFSEKERPKEAGFQWHPGRKVWYTKSPLIAFNLIAEADTESKEALKKVSDNLTFSHLLSSVGGLFGPRVHPDLTYREFQKAGIWNAVRRLKEHQSVAIFDQAGLGKTIQAIGILNELGFRKVLVVCPAFLRYNWYEEMKKWWVNFDDPAVIFSRKDKPGKGSVICSYDLAEILKPGYDCVIIDECHRLKNGKAKRTKKVLTNKNAVISGAKVIALSGTPLPNGKPEEIWTILSTLAPDVVAEFKGNKWSFINRFCIVDEDQHGKFVVGAKNHAELGNRLRGSGFMTRRLKSDVLTQLPDKRHSMIIIEPVGQTKKLLEKESAFSAEEIIAHGVPVGSGLPELRRTLGLSKIDASVNVIKELMDSGIEKMIVGAHHIDVIKGLEGGLKDYPVKVIMGSVSQKKRDSIVEWFQTTADRSILIGQIDAMGEGLTLTAAADVVQVEESWVPGKNEQFADRTHRIGQTRGVTVHHIVYRESLDAKIFLAHTEKSLDSQQIVG